MPREINKFKIKIRLFFGLILAFIIIWLFYQAIVPGGQIFYNFNFKKPSEFILPLTPKERVEEPQNGSQKIVGDPAYFSLRTPRTFDTAKLTIKYKNNSNQPLIEAGVLTDKTVWNYNLQPIENKTIDNLAKTWNVMREGDLLLLQREKKFNSLADFQNNIPPREEIALYNYDLKNDFVLTKDEKPVSANPKYNFVSLRGQFQYYTYLKKEEDLKFDFDFVDLNKNKDSDPIDINLYYQNKLVDTYHLDDDGDRTEAGRKSGIRNLLVRRSPAEQDEGGELGTPNLPAGVYKIELKCNDDIITKNIKTNNKTAFINRLWFYGGENIKIFTDSHFINAQTINPGSLQKIKTNDGDLDLSETYKQFGLKLKDKQSEINIAKGDVILSGDGVFAFSVDNLFNPSIRKIDANFDADQEGVNYILARYQSPREENGWKIAEAEFNLKGIYREFYKYSFMLSVPGLKEGNVEIGEIKVDLKGRSLFEKAWDVIKRLKS
jgi:hypothetical protein